MQIVKEAKKITAAQIAIGIICLVMAYAITLQIKSVKTNKYTNNSEAVRVEDLQVQLRKEREKTDQLTQQIIQYKDDLQSFKVEASNSSDYSKTLSNQLEKAEILAGLTDVEGSGISVTLRDNRSKDQLLGDPNLYVIHDTDILSVINVLCDSGAEAISLNGERIVATSEIICAGATVSINNNRYSEPYEIKAIGDPVNMENAILMRDGVYDNLTYYGLEVNVKKINKHKINRYNGTINYKYAVPVQPAQPAPKEGE